MTHSVLRLNRIHWLALLILLIITISRPVPGALAQSGSAITSPATGSSVRGSVAVRGTATSDSFARYELYFKQEPSGDESFIWFAGNTTQVFDGELGTWQTGDLPAGTYTLRLRIVRPDGNYGEFFARDLRVNLEAPTATPTETPTGPTATPIPIDTPTPIAQPTPAPVAVVQPDLAEPTPTQELVALNNDSSSNNNSNNESAIAVSAGEPQSTGAGSTASEGNAITRELGAAISLDRLGERFFTGVRWAGGIFLIVLAVFVVKWLIQWAVARTS